MPNNPAFLQTAGLVPHFAQLAKVGSTNTALGGLAGLHPFSVLLSTHQTRGRGRRDRTWHSRPGESLALSVVIPGDSARSFASSWVPLVVGWAVVEALTSLGVKGPALKWPNDVLVSGQKVAGVLCEMLPDGQVIAGVGTNLAFEGEAPTVTAAALEEFRVLREETPDVYVSTMIRHLREAMVLPADVVRSQVISVMSTLGRGVEVVEPGKSPWSGRALRLDEAGHLVVSDSLGDEHVVVASDVEHLLQ